MDKYTKFADKAYSEAEKLYTKIKPILRGDYNDEAAVDRLPNREEIYELLDAWENRFGDNDTLTRIVSVGHAPYRLHIRIVSEDYSAERFNIILTLKTRGDVLIKDRVTSLDKTAFMSALLALFDEEDLKTYFKMSHAEIKELLHAVKKPVSVKVKPKVALSLSSPTKASANTMNSATSSAVSSSFLGLTTDTENEYASDKGMLDYLEDAGFDYLLPQEDVKDIYNVDPANTIINNIYDGNYDDEEDGERSFYNDIYSMESEPYEYKDEESDDDIDNISYYRLKEIFSCTELSDDEFLKSTPWGLMGITAHQFHKISAANFTELNFDIFVERMTNQFIIETIPDVDNRIRYATLFANSNMNYANYHFNNTDDALYILKLGSGRTLNEAIMLTQLYVDYVLSRHNAQEYNDEFILGADNPEHPYYTYPLYPKPSAIKDLHDKATRDAVTYSDKKSELEREKLNELITEYINTPEYRKFLYRGKDYSVIEAKSVEDLKEEGKALNHCIGTYGNKFASRQCAIYFVRRNKEIDTPFYSAEILIKDGHNELSQLYTYADSTDKTDDFRAFVEEWCRVKKLYVTCAL